MLSASSQFKRPPFAYILILAPALLHLGVLPKVWKRMPMGLGSSSNSNKLKGVAVDSGAAHGTPSAPTSKNNAGQGLILGEKLRALIVDDNRVIRKIHRRLLTNLGVECEEAENGKEAVDLCHAGAAFDVILMDMEMPIMDGPQATRLLRGMGIYTKIVGVTGNSRNSDMVEFMNAGIDAFYSKPITRSDLIDILGELLDH